jgi:hypothetical protein
MYGAAAAIASLAHDPLRQSTICSPVAAILQYCADNRAKPATTCFELPSGRRRAGKPAPSGRSERHAVTLPYRRPGWVTLAWH